MSVDLVGYSAFKAFSTYAVAGDDNPFPKWVVPFRTFYQEFPRALATAYDEAKLKLDPSNSDGVPKLWKTIGDEIVFCNRVTSIDHLAACVSAFVFALEKYAAKLEADGYPLRLKAAGWLAAFPSPNVTISVRDASTSDDAGSPDANADDLEQIEHAADRNPRDFDFLGKGIDTGFRIAKNSSEDKFVLSVQLAYCLALAAKEHKFLHPLSFHGSQSLKGVIDGRPYPILSVDTERSSAERELRSREEALLGSRSQSPFALADFLSVFMAQRNIDIPYLWSRDQNRPDHLREPASYESFKGKFSDVLKDDEETAAEFVEATEPDNPDDRALDQSAAYLEKLSRSIEKFSLDLHKGMSARDKLGDNEEPVA